MRTPEPAPHKAATRKRVLRTGHPLWTETANISAPALVEPPGAAWDLVIVGTGISAALLAERMTRRKRRVLLVDRRTPVRGSSMASTAMIQHEIDLPLTDLAALIGAENAARAWRRSVRAVDDLVALSGRLGLDCQMERKQALYLTGADKGQRAMQAEVRARTAAGIGAEYLDGATLRSRFGIDRTGAILSAASASANPAQLTAALLHTALRRGAEIAAPVEITDMAELPGGIALATGSGRVLVAKHAVFCTGYEFLPQMQSSHHRIISTWALASEPGIPRPGWLDGMLVWEAADPYLYLRTTPNGRIIAGGEDVDQDQVYKDPKLMRDKARIIAEKIRETVNVRIGRPAYVWAAAFGNTDDGLPIIDTVPGHARAHAVMGFGGNGITWSMIAAQVIAGRIEGRPDPDADLFRYR